MKKDNTYLFKDAPVGKAIIALVVPTIISQLIHVFYNMADTFFIGQLNDPRQVAAATLSMPIFIMLTGITNLFGIGGASLISRSLGAGNREKARHAAAFSILSGIGIALFYGIFILIFAPVILPKIGADDSTYEFCRSYVFWTVTIGALPTILSGILSHLVRAEGYSTQASFGIAFGGILNIALDPLLIITFKMDITGAAVATMVSNLAATIYYIVFLIKHKNETVLSFNPADYTLKESIPREVLLVGLPSCIMFILSIFSNIVLNRLVSSYSTEAIAGMGIAKKIDMLVMAVANGLTQGVLPLIGFNYAAKNFERMRKSIQLTFVISVIVSAATMLFLLFCAVPIVRFFINDSATIEYGQYFLQVIALSCVFISVCMMIITIMQAVGSKIMPMFLSLLRKGVLDVPFMFLMRKLIGQNGIPWATPMSDLVATIISVIVFAFFWKKLKTEMSTLKPI